MYEDDFELKQGIDEDIAKILLDLQEKHFKSVLLDDITEYTQDKLFDIVTDN